MCAMPGCLYPDEPLRHDAPRNHPLKATVDHIVPVGSTQDWTDHEREALLYDPKYLRPAHRACNRSTRKTAERARQQPERHSRDWGV